MRQKREDSPSVTGLARLRSPAGIAGRIRRAVQAAQRVPRQDVTPAGRWVEDHAGLLLDAADALGRDLRFAPRLPAMQGTPREIFSQVEKMKQLQLDVPQVTLLAHELREQGLKIPESVLTKEELAAALFGELPDQDGAPISKTGSAQSGEKEASHGNQG